MRLSDFIRTNHSAIVREWETFAATLLPAASGMTQLALRDHAEEILDAVVADLELPQNATEQSQKSKGHGEEHRMEEVGRIHAAVRIEGGFGLSQLVAEYRALRASVLRLFERAAGETCATDLRQVTRFNEAIDEALVEATDRFMLVMNRTSDQFLAVLGHDLRNPLGAISMSAGLISRRADHTNTKAASLILTSAERMSRMVDDLLDLTRTRLGSGIPIAPEPTDLKSLGEEVVAELEAFHPDRPMDFHADGNLRGSWDRDRLAQVLSNLLGNALQYGARDRPIEVAVRGDGEEVVIEVHNEGRPIPPAMLANIFEPMVRGGGRREGDKLSRSLGLGLHIAREIVLAHGGTVSVKSTGSEGTTFCVRLPRHAATSPMAEPPKHEDTHDATGVTVVAEGGHAADNELR
jgi:signal transduction histidine kinase